LHLKRRIVVTDVDDVATYEFSTPATVVVPVATVVMPVAFVVMPVTINC
jgi:hypothetical protein